MAGNESTRQLKKYRPTAKLLILNVSILPGIFLFVSFLCAIESSLLIYFQLFIFALKKHTQKQSEKIFEQNIYLLHCRFLVNYLKSANTSNDI